MGFGETILRIMGALLALVIVLALAWFVLHWLSKRMGGVSAFGRSGRLLQVLDRTPLGKNSSLVLVRVQNKVYLLALSEHCIQTVNEWDDPDENIKPPPPPENLLSFQDALKEAAKKLKKPDRPNGPGGTT